MRLAIVNDSAFARQSLLRTVAMGPGWTVAWVARNGLEAVERCAQDRPDLILMDLLMPEMDGVTATHRIMHTCPCPILIVTYSVGRNAARAFQAMDAGAIDVVPTPADGQQGDELLRKIAQFDRLRARGTCPAILIGASVGGPAALAFLLRELSPDLPAGLVLAQHLDPRFGAEFVAWLCNQSALRVRAAEAGDAIEPGTVLVCARDTHVVFVENGRLGYTHEPVSYHLPSINALFSSAAKMRGGPLAAVLLTGMGSDGAVGLKALRAAGHLTIAQDEATSAVYGMPRAAARLQAAVETLPLSQIAARLERFARQP